EIEARAHNEAETDLLCSPMRAHDTGQRVAIRDRQRRETLALGFRHQFMRMRTAAQKGEVGRRLQFGIGGRRERSHGINPCMNQRGAPTKRFSSFLTSSRSL